MTVTVSRLAARLAAEAPPDAKLRLAFGTCVIEVESNEPTLLDALKDYYAAFDDETAERREPIFHVRAHQMEPPDLELPYEHWTREPGKDRGKEAFVDLPDGRAVLKVRTGMQYLVDRDVRVAFGNCLASANQVVNFINFQFTAWHVNRGRALCHAAGVARDGRGLALASLSGGGKSTLALRLMGEGFDFVSNDRVLVGRDEAGRREMWGVPKHPRVNPGTILGDPNLSGLLSPEREAALRSLPKDELWVLEEKYDARIDRLYGPGRVAARAPLRALLALAWHPRDDAPARFEEIRLRDDAKVLDAIMKSPGPFFLPDGGRAPRGYEPPDPKPYLDALDGVPIAVARGGVDFAQGVAYAQSLLAR